MTQIPALPFERSDERVVAGVCGGIAQSLRVDPTAVRLVFALLALACGAGILLYLALWTWSSGRGSSAVVFTERGKRRRSACAGLLSSLPTSLFAMASTDVDGSSRRKSGNLVSSDTVRTEQEHGRHIFIHHSGRRQRPCFDRKAPRTLPGGMREARASCPAPYF